MLKVPGKSKQVYSFTLCFTYFVIRKIIADDSYILSGITMMQIKHKTIFRIGLLLFFLTNLVTACFLEPHYDENYYWIYAQFLDWGYFDHPPMVGFLIFAGLKLLPGYLGMRLFFVLLSSLTFVLLWKLVKVYLDDPLVYWTAVFAICCFIPYSFMAVPDGPLLFFTVLFLWAYRQFLQQNSVGMALLLGITAAAMVYSKYHAFLVFLFVFVSNLQLIRNRKVWLAAVVALGLLLPHFYWQYTNGFPSFKYHLVDSHQTSYKVSVTFSYLVNQLVLTGPLLGWFFLFAAAKVKTEGQFEKSLKYIFAGVFIFFFLVTFGGDIEPHWPLVAYFPMLILTARYLREKPSWKPVVVKVGSLTFFLALVVRAVALIYGPTAEVKPLARFFNNLSDKTSIYQAVGDYPVVFQDNYRSASAYAHANNKAHDTWLMGAGFSRYTQYDLLPMEEQLQGKTVVLVTRDSLLLPADRMKIAGRKNIWYAKKVENFRSFNLLEVRVSPDSVLFDGQKIEVRGMELYNPYQRPVELSIDPQFPAHVQCYVRGKKQWEPVGSATLQPVVLAPGQTTAAGAVEFVIPKHWPAGEKDIFIGVNNGFFLPVHSGIVKTIQIQ